MTKPPTVAHAIRTFLSPTETFVGNQIMTLQRYRAVVCCHQRRSNSPFSVADMCCLQEALPPIPRLVDAIHYRAARHLPKASATKVADYLKTQSVDLIHFHYLVDARYFLAVKHLTSLPSVVSVYGYDISSFPRIGWGYGARYLKPIFRDLDCFIAMSEDMRCDLVKLGCPEDKIVVHYHGIDTDRFAYPERTYSDPATLDILMCGTLEPKKAQDRVLQALRLWELRKRTPQPFHVTFMGDGPLRANLEKLVAAYGWQHRVRFLGHVSHHDPRLVEEYRQADIFTLPSVTLAGDKEGIPGSLIEAMACGLPVVSTFHAGIPEVISHEQDGLLVEEFDLAGLSAALERVIEERPLRERLGRAAAHTAATRCRLLSRTPHLERIYDRVVEPAVL